MVFTISGVKRRGPEQPKKISALGNRISQSTLSVIFNCIRGFGDIHIARHNFVNHPLNHKR